MSLTLMSTSSTDDPAMISNDGNDLLAHVDLDLLVIEPALAQLLAQLLARPLRLLADRRRPDRRSPASRGSGGSSRSRTRSSAACRAFSRTSAMPLLADHVDGDLDEVADHRLDVAPDVADLGELRRLDLDERRLRQLRQPPRDLGLADAGRADHQDVLRRDLLGQLGAAASGGASGCAARSRRRASPGPGRRRTCRARRRSDAASAPRSWRRWFLEDRWACRPAYSDFDRDGVVRVDADRGGDLHRLLRDRARVELGVLRQRLGRRQRVRAARSDRDDPVVGLDQVAGARQQVGRLARPSRRASPRAGAGCGRCASPSRARRPIAPDCRGTVRAWPRTARRARRSRRPSRRSRRGSGRCRAGGSCARVCLTTVSPKVTWPSLAMTVWSRCRTARTVVA